MIKPVANTTQSILIKYKKESVVICVLGEKQTVHKKPEAGTNSPSKYSSSLSDWPIKEANLEIYVGFNLV